MLKIALPLLACTGIAMTRTQEQDPAVKTAFDNIKKLKEKGNMEYVDGVRLHQWAYLWFVNRVTTKESIFLYPGTLQVLSSLSLTDTKGNVLEPARKAFDRLITLPKTDT